MNHIVLNNAKKAKDDEFYTYYEDIEKELDNYDINFFNNKIIYCCCDMPESNFVKYFENNKQRFNYKELIHTSLQEGYDFRSDYCIDIMKKSDIIITNPPFSLLSQLVDILDRLNKDFILIIPLHAYAYKTIFNLIKLNKARLGYTYRSGEAMFFDHYGKKSKRVSARWLTTLNVDTYKSLELTKIYDKNYYKKYDNTDIINVDKTKEIPKDYYGLMGVPISFIAHYSPNQFSIEGMINSPTIDNKNLFKRIIIKRVAK